MRTLMWFTRDLRLEDNAALHACRHADQLLCVFVVEPAWFEPGPWQCKPLGSHRWRFLWQTLQDLENQLHSRGQRLHIAWGDPRKVIPDLCHSYRIDRLCVSHQPGSYEARHLQHIRTAMPGLAVNAYASLTLFEPRDLPFAINELPGTFSGFRRLVEKHRLAPAKPIPAPVTLPPAPGVPDDDRRQLPPVPTDPTKPLMTGGSRAAEAHVSTYMSGGFLATYKETRNALDDWTASGKFSPWLANGSLSVRSLWHAVATFEQEVVSNDSTYWMQFELLWREYFYWYAIAHQGRLFARDGVQRIKRHGSFYPQRFRAWQEGNTPYPIVNACMKQLKATGYMSNRGRQLVASCLVHELAMDWRYGAAWFEEQLLDYDVASNYGNWQYLAGVGADPRGWRQFDLAKQARQYDPDGAFVQRWQGDSKQQVPLYTVDAADWPIG